MFTLDIDWSVTDLWTDSSNDKLKGMFLGVCVRMQASISPASNEIMPPSATVHYYYWDSGLLGKG